MENNAILSIIHSITTDVAKETLFRARGRIVKFLAELGSTDTRILAARGLRSYATRTASSFAPTTTTLSCRRLGLSWPNLISGRFVIYPLRRVLFPFELSRATQKHSTTTAHFTEQESIAVYPWIPLPASVRPCIAIACPFGINCVLFSPQSAL